MRILAYGDGADHWKSAILEKFSSVDVTAVNDLRHPVRNLQEIDVLIGWRFPEDLLKQLSGLSWIQLICVGPDAWVRHPLVGAHISITTTKGLYADSVAEYVIWALLTLSRKYHIVLHNQLKHRWKHVSGPGLKGKVVGILGLGNIGKEVAIRAKGMEMKVVGIVRQIPNSHIPPAVDELYSFQDLPRALKEVDALVLSVPLTDDTRNLINEEAYRSMKPGVLLVNLCRAEVASENLVIQALKEGKLGGAALDVFEKEPLSRWSRLWKVKDLIVTPHLCGLTTDYFERVGNLICENIDRFQMGKPLVNLVDRNKGY